MPSRPSNAPKPLSVSRGTKRSSISASLCPGAPKYPGVGAAFTLQPASYGVVNRCEMRVRCVLGACRRSCGIASREDRLSPLGRAPSGVGIEAGLLHLCFCPALQFLDGA
jgi:hypothetical protein